MTFAEIMDYLGPLTTLSIVISDFQKVVLKRTQGLLLTNQTFDKDLGRFPVLHTSKLSWIEAFLKDFETKLKPTRRTLRVNV